MTINDPYPLTAGQIRRYREDGFVKLKNVFTRDVLDRYAPVITRLTLERNRFTDVPLEERSTYDKAFIQVGNLWELDEAAKEFAFGRRLAGIAAELMGTQGVRMWHDQSLYKEPGGGFTPWHADQQYWPMASGRSVTAWVPLQAVPIEMGPLCFGKGSHLKNMGRDLHIGDDSERRIRQMIQDNGVVEVREAFELGEVSFHSGWTLHRAGGNDTKTPRKVHTIIYMDADMRLAEPKNDFQKADRNRWTPNIEVGQVMDGPLTPVLYKVR